MIYTLLKRVLIFNKVYKVAFVNKEYSKYCKILSRSKYKIKYRKEVKE